MNLKCKECGNTRVVNKFHQMCADCNNIRLHGSKYGKVGKLVQTKRKPVRTAKKGLKGRVSISARVRVGVRTTRDKIIEDEAFYEKCFNMSNNKCEECGEELPSAFLTDSGKVAARWRYSHIIPKSIAPKLRHDTNNINHLCLKHHSEWENGNKEKMKIFKGNKKRFPNHL